MKIGIFGLVNYSNFNKELSYILSELTKSGIKPLVEERLKNDLNEDFISDFEGFSLHKSSISKLDLILSLGGDGTMLKTASHVGDSEVPIAGINTGRLGFLSTIQRGDIQVLISSILENKLKIVERNLLEVKGVEVNIPYALNEMTVTLKNTATMIAIDTFLNDEFLTTYWADGLIIGTPTGSTAYSLSCGGPIITPDSDVLVITPIAPHNLNSRPLIIPKDTKIRLRVNGRGNKHMVSIDSHTTAVKNNCEIYVQKAPFKIKLVELKSESFLKTLRKKLLWGEDKRN